MMNKLLILFFCLCLISPSYAEDAEVPENSSELTENKPEGTVNISEENLQEVNVVISEGELNKTVSSNPEEQPQQTDNVKSNETSQNADTPVIEELLEKADEENALNSPKQPEYEEIREVVEEIVSLPACDDENLQKETYKYINDYFNLSPNEGTLFRRRRYFILHNLDKFREENIANYKTEKTSPVSDIIAMTKVNKGIAEENLRLCKNIAKDKFAGKIYLLIYPEQNGVRTRVINLVDKQRADDEASFFYENNK